MALEKDHREGITFPQLLAIFPDDATAERWLRHRVGAANRPARIAAPCNVQAGAKHATMS